MADVPDETIDRLLAGELPAAEQRRIAQAALDDPDLFELLTAAGVVTNSVDAKNAKAPSSVLNNSSVAPGAPWTRPRVIVMTMVAAAAAIVLAVAIGRTRNAATPAPTGNVAQAPVIPAAIPPPLLLTARLDAASQPAFRTDAGTSRLPRQTGTIVSVHDGEVDLDLGSLDGLKQGSELRAVHGREDARNGSRVTITVVFRERSRGRLAAGVQVQAGDRVDVAPAVHVSAILEQAAARSAAGDLPGARRLAQLAVSRARTADVSADVRRRSLDQLGRLEHEAGDLDASAPLLAEAADEFDIAPPATPDERAGVLNELGAIRIEQRDFAAAERTLQSARSFATGVLLMRVTNNLGAVAALRGDLAAAGTLYRQARSLAGDSAALAADRQAIDKNLDGLKSSR
jgi:hypothetical protein